MPLSFEITSALETLSRGSECIDAVRSMNTEDNRFTRALQDLQHLAEKEHISLAIVGDLGAIHFGYPAAIQDIDIAIDRRNLQSLIQGSSRYGLKVVWESKSGWHTLTHDDCDSNFSVPSVVTNKSQYLPRRTRSSQRKKQSTKDNEHLSSHQEPTFCVSDFSVNSVHSVVKNEIAIFTTENTKFTKGNIKHQAQRTLQFSPRTDFLRC